MTSAISGWRRESIAVIEKAVSALPATATAEEKKKAIDAAYPFGPRKYHPYKIWLQERRKAFVKLRIATPKGKGLFAHESPLERQMRRSREIETMKEAQS